MDAGREHEYGHVNDLQNKFAQKYYKLGLHTPARQLYDDLLSDIEQRFLTHVYNEKICKGASSEEISNVLQSHVIDPIVAKYTNTQANARTVITALYFLTERCHIRWDAP
jgi:protein SERAC1